MAEGSNVFMFDIIELQFAYDAQVSVVARQMQKRQVKASSEGAPVQNMSLDDYYTEYGIQ
jgi:hypothetical protein